MASPLLDAVTSGTRRAYSLIISAVERGLGNNAVARFLQAEGFGARIGDVRQVANRIRETVRAAQRISAGDPSVTFGREAIPVSPASIRHGYQYGFRFTATTPAGVVINTRYFTLGSSTPLSLTEAVRQVQRAIPTRVSCEEIVGTELELLRVYRDAFLTE